MEEKKMNQEPENSTTPTPTPNPTEEKVKETLAAGKEALAVGKEALTAGAGKLKEKAKELKAQAQQAQAEKQAAGTDGADSPAPKKNKVNKMFLGIGAAVLALILLVAAMAGGRTKVNMKDYIAMTFTGLDGKGTASMTVNYSDLAKLAKISSKKSDNQLTQMIYVLGEELVKEDLLEKGFKCTLENAKGLSNGDKVTVKITANDSICKQLNIKIKDQTLTFKVEGLTQVTSFDAFADIEVSFSGISPQGTATLLNNSRDEACMSYSYSLDVNSGLSNGDTVTVTISESGIDRVAEQTGKAPEVLSKQYTVSGLSTYVTELSQISDEAMKSMRKEAEDTLNAYAANNWSSDESLEGMKYLGSYLLTKKPHSTENLENILWLVYEVSYKNTWSGADYEMTYYYYTWYRNLHNDDENNTMVDLSNRGAPNQRYYFRVANEWYDRFYVLGFKSLPELYKYCVTGHMDNYTYESSVS